MHEGNNHAAGMQHKIEYRSTRDFHPAWLQKFLNQITETAGLLMKRGSSILEPMKVALCNPTSQAGAGL